MPKPQNHITHSVESAGISLGHHEAIGESKAFLDFQEKLRRVAPVERPILLIGERGTGKEMAAKRLHFLSKRWGQPFVPLNCSALTPSLIESELFGHEEGSFTGATRRRIGRFEAANGGTLFLDEISLIPMEVQEKILRVVEYGAFERVGGTRPVQVDVRIIGATNCDLLKEAAQGRFKPDLLDRLSFEVLFLPPLRERQEDIPILANHFASRMAFELGRDDIPLFSEAAVDAMVRYRWPGNIRELKNVVERAVYRSDSNTVDEIDFYPFDSPYAPSIDGTDEECPKRSAESADSDYQASQPALDGISDIGNVSLPSALRAVEVQFLRKALQVSHYNQRLAAETLGLTYDQFRGLYRKHADAVRAEERA